MSLTPHHRLRRLAVAMLLMATCGATALAQGTGGDEPEADIAMPDLPQRVYTDVSKLPNAVKYLPAPPDTASAMFISDFTQWQWGTSVRNTKRGLQASNESQFGLNRLAIILGPVIGTPMTSARTPNMIRLIYQVGETGSRSTQYAKIAHKRKRPFEQMGEHTWGRYDSEDELRGNGSYPSAHSAFGWAVGLVFAEMLPELQDTILSRAFQYGESRVIVGAHWQSDVEAARLTAAAAVARMHNEPDFYADLAAAREEYYALRGTERPDVSTLGWPDVARFIESPIDTTSVRYLSDVAQYWAMKPDRSGERGEQARADADVTFDGLLDAYGTVLGGRLSEQLTPAVADVLWRAHAALTDAAEQMRSRAPKRKRPYVQLGEPSLIEADEARLDTVSSYPSVAATVAWGTALLMAEIATEHQDDLLKQGFEMGRSRQIAGYAYASDVVAGRTLACAVVARLHADDDFAAMMARAKIEHNSEQIFTELNDVLDRSAAAPDGWFTIDGRQLAAEPHTPGIYVHAGQKVVR